MPEHRIRLRGGWECHYREGDDGDGPEIVRRVNLPITWTDDLPRKIRLIRQFGKPPVDLQVEVVSLELRNVYGLEVARINGRESTVATSSDDSRSIALGDPLLPRNGLILEINLAEAQAREGEWGEIWLSIRPREP